MKLKQILENNKIISDNTDKHNAHTYVDDFYEQFFYQYKDKKINILEIGIRTGGSIALWSEYFKNANIFGIDISSQGLNSNFSNLKNTTLYFENAYSEQFLSKIENMDIIIDDGPHTLDSMIYVVQHYSSKINSNGMIVIEDVQFIPWISTLAAYVPKNFGFNFFDLRPENNKESDNILFVMKRFD